MVYGGLFVLRLVVVTAALERLTQQELAEAAGIKLATAGAGRSLAKAIPLIGAAISGAVESYTAEQVARRAKESFAPGQTEVVAECSWCVILTQSSPYPRLTSSSPHPHLILSQVPADGGACVTSQAIKRIYDRTFF